MTNDNTFGKSDSCYLLTGNLLLADVVLLDKDGTRVFKASIAEVKNQGCPVGGLAVSTGTFWQTWFHSPANDSKVTLIDTFLHTRV